MVSPPENYKRTYRIVSSKYPPISGSGTFRWGSRWISPGRYVVHAAESWSLAVLENLVHWQRSRLPPTLACVPVDVPDSIEQEKLLRTDLPEADTRDYAPFREIGDEWYDRGESAILWVPSLVSPVEFNLLLHQEHEDFDHIIVREALPVPVDPRLRTASRPTGK